MLFIVVVVNLSYITRSEQLIGVCELSLYLLVMCLYLIKAYFVFNYYQLLPFMTAKSYACVRFSLVKLSVFVFSFAPLHNSSLSCCLGEKQVYLVHFTNLLTVRF